MDGAEFRRIANLQGNGIWSSYVIVYSNRCCLGTNLNGEKWLVGRKIRKSLISDGTTVASIEKYGTSADIRCRFRWVARQGEILFLQPLGNKDWVNGEIFCRF